MYGIRKVWAQLGRGGGGTWSCAFAFTAPAPNRLWVADITYIKTHSGWVYASFVLDVFSRRIVGRQLATNLYTDLALDVLNMGIWTRRHAGGDLYSDVGPPPVRHRPSPPLLRPETPLLLVCTAR